MKLAILLPAFALALSSCSAVKKVTEIPVPFLGDKSEETEVAFEDREVPYQIKQSLGSGHTLKFSVYAGQRSPKKLYSGTGVVDANGILSLDKHGEVKVGGLKAAEAAHAIGVMFRREQGHLVINVQLEEIEGTQLVLVEGAVKNPGEAPWFDEANSLNILKYVDGHDGKSRGEAVYITRNGVRKFYPTAATTEGGHPLLPGDIVHYSKDL